MTGKEEEGCWNCKFMYEKSYANFCRRFPPVWIGDTWAFPGVDVDSDEFCAEWKKKDKEAGELPDEEAPF